MRALLAGVFWAVLVYPSFVASQAADQAPSKQSPENERVSDEQWLVQHRQWQKQRLQRLTEPDGWLTLIGLHWLPSEADALVVGSADGSDIQLNRGPELLGRLTIDAGTVRLDQMPQSPDNLDDPIDSLQWAGSKASVSRLSFGDWSVELIERDGRFGLRERHAEAPTRVNFAGLEAFPPDRDWQIQARFSPHQPSRTMTMATVAGVNDIIPNPGRLHFTFDGQEYDLEALRFDGSDELFLVIGDRSNGRTTYGGGRFLYTDLPDEQMQVSIDFNRAYNPPCVFTEFSTCPLPPPGNRLDFAVRAGERLPTGYN